MLLTRRVEFSASHRIWREEWAPERNRQVFGKLARPFSHGHNYTLEVTVRGEVDPETGMVIDLKALRDVIDREIGTRFDHRDLNDDSPHFGDRPPTAENFSRVIFELLDAALPDELLDCVRLWPVPDLCAEVRR